MPESLRMFFIDTGSVALDAGAVTLLNWVTALIALIPFLLLARVVTRVRKIQRAKRDWSVLRHEIMWSTITGIVVVMTLKYSYTFLVTEGFITIDASPAAWYVVAGEFFLYFFVFDLYFYSVHRLIHIGPLYRWIHKVHHRSTEPIPLTNFSTHPVEGLAEAAITPIFLSVVTVHEASLPFIIPMAILMGFWAHLGYEFFPRWWYRTWLTKWFMTPMFHDQHHQYFHYNFGFTTIWDRIFGTIRKQFDEDFEKRGGAPTEEMSKRLQAAGEPG